MKRRSFLAMLGLAPVAAVPVVAAGMSPNEYLSNIIGKSGLPIAAHQKWLSDGMRAMEGRLDTHGLTLADA
ncbi:hypothetical protein MIC97_08620 [Aquamicrobium sp. NLF2-7]|uniref:hypothetical protein n=1 Tax=Aquamicrobium sp. NLF2-7 TaxID=2918753 RepID=UPI001EFA6F4C|nr:hypothetical protein [Aquamicrobium sp. NLF2-7]MCG8271564.1 hypothetical protein [Aquamicrobium sp. NLF2-7]